MTFYLQYQIDDENAKRFFELAGHHTRNMSTPFGNVKRRIMHMIFENFETEGIVFPSPGYYKWAPLNEKYERKKEEQGYPTKIGRRTGEMRRNALRGVSSGNGWVELHITRYEGDTDIAEVFNDGRGPAGKSKFGQLPRPLWETTPGFIEEVNFIFWKWLAELKRLNVRRRAAPFDFSSIQLEPTITH